MRLGCVSKGCGPRVDVCPVRCITKKSENERRWTRKKKSQHNPISRRRRGVKKFEAKDCAKTMRKRGGKERERERVAFPQTGKMKREKGKR